MCNNKSSAVCCGVSCLGLADANVEVMISNKGNTGNEFLKIQEDTSTLPSHLIDLHGIALALAFSSSIIHTCCVCVPGVQVA